jgi:short-subunit dehydrogenase
MNLKGKIAVVTGAGGGLGRLLVKELDKEGVICVLVEKERSLFEGLMDLLDGKDHTFFECDFANESEVELLVDKISSNFNKIDFLFNLAGIGIYKNIDELTIDEWKQSVSVNLTAPFILVKGLLPSLIQSKGALVVNFGSGMGIIPTAGRVAYCSSKFGLRGMSLTLSKELENKNVDFCLMTLGSIMTNFGTGGLAIRKQFEKEGKKYLGPIEVVNKVMEITKSEERKEEYVVYPEGYDLETKQ